MPPPKEDFSTGFQGEQCLSTAIATLYKELWPLRQYDRCLHTGFIGSMSALKANKMTAIGVGSQSNGRHPLFCFIPTVDQASSSKIKTAFLQKVESLQKENGSRHFEVSLFSDLQDAKACNICAIFRQIKTLDGNSVACESSGNFMNYCVLFLRMPKETVADVNRARWKQFCGESVVPMFFDLFRHRERRMMPFAPEISRLYWEEAAKPPSKTRFHPPWDLSEIGDGRGAMRMTVTLSVDLRKSTFCMDQAEDQPAFGRWLDRLVQEIIHGCHKHAGIFDKFTGDGGLMHFLDDECKATVDKTAIEAAFLCAVHLRSTVDALLPALRKNLRNNSDLLGAGISIAASEAFWSVDHRDNPIVVGHGVVDACRICDGTPPRTIRMSNLAYSHLAVATPPMANLFMETDLGGTKEWNAEMKLKVWQMKAG